ncbi:MAG: hypothetical protein IKO76_00315 [Butyrivibrio sp.]|nr:hypothetical protein [Butyrivibrio sp.]
MLLKKPDILVFFFFLLAYTAFLLSLYPGFFVYDATTVLHFYQRWELTTFHPIFHSLLLPAIVEGVYQLTNSYNLGIATWMFIQILVMSAIGTFLIYELRRKKIPLYFRLLTILFLSCFPTIIMYVLCSASDSLFCMNMLLSSILLLSLFKEPDLFWSSKKRQIFLFISLTLMFLLRKNGNYAFVVFVPFLIFTCRKKLPKILLLALLPIILSTGIITFLETVTNAEKAGFAEAYSTPLQQLSRVYTSHKDELTDEEINLYLQVQDDERWMLYDPKIADEIKEFADMHVVKQNLGDYVSLYTKLFFKYPLDYIDAFLMTTYEQWYPYSIYDCYHGGPYDDCCYFGYMVEEPGSKQPQWERLDMVFEWLSVHSEPHKIPVLHLLLSPAFYLWIFLFSMTYSLRRKWYYNNLAMLFMFLVFLTVLLGPCALVRYVAYLFFAAPLYLSMLFDM